MGLICLLKLMKCFCMQYVLNFSLEGGSSPRTPPVRKSVQSRGTMEEMGIRPYKLHDAEL